MSRNNVVYRPPDSDSDDDYDGFAFGDDVSIPNISFCVDAVSRTIVFYLQIIQKNKPVTNWQTNSDEELYEALMKGDLQELKQQVELTSFDVDEPVRCK